MKKRIAALGLSLTMVMSVVTMAAGVEKTITVTPMALSINGQVVIPTKSDGNPAEVFAYDGATYVPLRYLSELLGIQVDWDKSDPNTAKLVGDNLKATADTAFNPGTYTVSAMGHNANIVVDVTFSSNAITDIKVVEEKESKTIGDVAMETMSKEILERQSLKVDTLSGATVTGAIFRSLITQAVREAGGDPSKMQTPAAPLSSESLPDEDVDIVVVGGGATGLAATLKAAETGLNVILVEQLGIIGGASARAGGLPAADTKVLTKYNKTYTADQLYEMLSAPLGENLADGLMDKEFCREHADRSGALIDWLYDLGTEFGEPWGTGIHFGENQERVMWSAVKVMHDRMDELKIDYRLNTKATELITEGNTIVGVKVTAPNGTGYTIRAKGVILATGGYLGSKEMVERYVPQYINNGTDVSIGNDGSGLEMALSVGAGTSCMDSVVLHGLAGFYNGTSRSLTTPAGHGCIAVNQDGVRYCAESAEYADLGAATLKQERAYCIIDDELFNMPIIKNEYSLAGLKEMYIICDTVEELAEAIDVPVDALKNTIERYTTFIHNGVDEDFHKETLRGGAGMVTDFSKGPYYAVKTQPENHTVYGGITIDNSARVLREDGSSIKGLYAAGELTCFKAAGRTVVGECMDMGQVAVQTIKADAGL